MAAARFPWDSLKAESLRIVCRDLGGPPGRRDEMITFLRAVEEQGRVYINARLFSDIISTSYPYSGRCLAGVC